VYGLAAVDRRGRIADHAIMHALGWQPGTRLDIRETHGLLLIHADPQFWPHITTIQAVLPHFTPDGSITLLSAITARTGMPGTAGIAALNGAIEALVRPLAAELAPIRVNAVSPGLVDTPWWNGLPEDAKREYFAQTATTLPVRHIASAQEIAEVVALAATNANLTGTIIETDGGARLVSLG
jgi:NAD(P)-dependent dehydrogenase (short-subunit alcohol dehydrogenase family)